MHECNVPTDMPSQTCNVLTDMSAHSKPMCIHLMAMHQPDVQISNTEDDILRVLELIVAVSANY